MDIHEIRGWGIDARPESRPGVPMERVPSAHAALDRRVLVRGSAQPPHGLSGVLRKLAYRLGEHKPRRWLLLMAADRVDAVESFVGRALRRPAVWAAGAGLGLVLLARKLRA